MKRLIQTPSLVRDYCIKYFEDIFDLRYLTVPSLVYSDGPLGVEWRWQIPEGEIRYDINKNICSWVRQPKDILTPCKYLNNDIVSVYPVEFFYGGSSKFVRTVIEFKEIALCNAIDFPLIEWDDKSMKKQAREFPQWALNEKFNVPKAKIVVTVADVLLTPDKKCAFLFMGREFFLPVKKADDISAFFTPDTTDEQINSLYDKRLNALNISDETWEKLYLTALAINEDGEPDIRLGFKS